METIRKYLVSVSVLLLIVALSIFSFFIDVESFRDNIEAAGLFAPILYMLIKSSTVIFAPLSGTALYILSVPMFGFWNGLLYSFLGDFLGAVVTFYLSRFFGRPVIQYFAGKKNMIYIEKSLDLMSTVKGFILFRLASLTMPEIGSYGAGLSKLKFTQFIIIHMAIDLVPIIVMTSLGFFIGADLPLWVILIVIGLGILITLINVIIFGKVLKKEVQKEKLSSLPDTRN